MGDTTTSLPSDSHRPTSIKSLSTELVEKIAFWLTAKQDLGNIRLVNHWLLQETAATVSSGLFHTVRVSTQYKGLNRLVRIASHFKFGPAVRVLELSPHYLEYWDSRQFWKGQNLDLSFQHPAAAQAAEVEHNGRLKAQERMIESEADYGLLKAALEHLPSLRRVSIGQQGATRQPNDADTGHCSDVWSTTNRSPYSSHHHVTGIEHVFLCFLRAASNVYLSLDTLQVGILPGFLKGDQTGASITLDDLGIDNTQSFMSSDLFRSLRSLELCVKESVRDSEDWMHQDHLRLLSLLSCALNLESIDLSFEEPGYDGDDGFSRFTMAPLRLPKLMSLTLRRAVCSIHDFGSFLLDHSTTLRRLVICRVQMDDLETWKDFISRVALGNEFRLEEFELQWLRISDGSVKLIPGSCEECDMGQEDYGLRCEHIYVHAEHDIPGTLAPILETMVKVSQ